MFKTTVLAALVGILTATAVIPSNAAVLLPKPPKGSSSENCGYQLDYMARVTRASIEAIHDQSVYLVPVCETGNANDDYGSLFTSGNVSTLRLPIARNSTLMAALEAQGYDHQDVISLRVGGGNSIMLYVHQRNMR
nr:hypothetical protein [uncultured Devosia sp.]